MSVHNMHAFMSKSLRPSLIHLSVFKSARVCSSEPFRVSLSQRRGEITLLHVLIIAAVKQKTHKHAVFDVTP